MDPRQPCSRWVVRLSSYLDGEEPDPAAVDSHIATCEACRAWLGAVRRDRERLSQAYGHHLPRADFVDAVMRAIRAGSATTVYRPARVGVAEAAWLTRGVAIAAIAALIVLIAGPVVLQAQVSSESRVCAANLRDLALATRVYAGDYAHTLPLGGIWEAALEPYAGEASVFQCPAAMARPAYAYRPTLSGARLADMPWSWRSVLVYDASPATRQFDARHSGRGNAAFLDGHIEALHTLPGELRGVGKYGPRG